MEESPCPACRTGSSGLVCTSVWTTLPLDEQCADAGTLCAMPSVQAALKTIESHAALVQAIAAILSAIVAACALVYTVLALRALQKQTQASIAATVETFRPIIEVLGGELGALQSHLTIKNKGAGAALNLRWRLNEEPERWNAFGNLLAAGEERRLHIKGNPRSMGVVLSYESVAQKGELLTLAKFSQLNLEPWNQHVFSTSAGKTRMGWTTANPELEFPAYHTDLIASMPWHMRLYHWWNLKRGHERRL